MVPSDCTNQGTYYQVPVVIGATDDPDPCCRLAMASDTALSGSWDLTMISGRGRRLATHNRLLFSTLKSPVHPWS